MLDGSKEKTDFTLMNQNCLPIKGLKANLSYALIGDFQ